MSRIETYPSAPRRLGKQITPSEAESHRTSRALNAAKALLARYTIGSENCVEPLFIRATVEEIAAEILPHL